MKEFHLSHIIQNRAKLLGEKEAIRYKVKDQYESFSWNKFYKDITQTAKFLLSKGIDTDDKIGIFSQNHPEWSICDFGTISVRAVVVPIYPTASQFQLEYIAKETEMKMLCVGDNEQLDRAIEALNKLESLQYLLTFNCDKVEDERIISLKEILLEDYDNEVNNLLEKQKKEASTDDLATIIYTSGTTGEPKGAMLNHSNFIHTFKIHDERLVLGEDDVSMCFLPLSHVFERTWTYYVFYSGAVNVYNANPKAVIEELPKVKPTVMCVVPRFYEKTFEGLKLKMEEWSNIQKSIFNWALNVGLRYIEYRKSSATAPLSLRLKKSLAEKLVMKKFRTVFGGNIKYMPCAGSAISPELLKFFHAMGLFVNYGYGATETTATVSCMKYDEYDFNYTGTIMPDTEVKISEQDHMILVKGGIVFQGYYKKPKETEEVLKDGWYYTGDQGEIIGEDTLFMTERIKDIIKTSTGKYISPQKTELALSQSDLIEQLCVIGDNRKYLTALIVPVFPKLESIAKDHGIKYQNIKELVTNPVINNMVFEDIKSHQERLAPHERIAKFALLEEVFTIENALMTNSLKVRRKEVNKLYAKKIEDLY